MDPHYYGIVEMTLVFGVVLGLAFRELWSLRREQRRDAARAADGGDSGKAV